jgi:hypothetical protein
VGQLCVVGDQGTPDCVVPVVVGVESQVKSTGNGLIACSVGSLGTSAPGSSAREVLTVLLLAVLVGMRRRRR